MAYSFVFLLIGLLILVHEFGHLLAARLLGIPVARFAVGMGPRLWSTTRGGTEYRISAIPLGGYVLPYMGDDRTFLAQPAGKRIGFALGGPAANLAATVVLYAVLNCMQGGTGLFEVFVLPFAQTFTAMGKVLAVLPMLFTHPHQLTGLVGIVASGGDYVAGDVVRALQVAVVLNLNLVAINLLPLPPLDGGKVVLYALEKIDVGLRRLHLPLSAAGWIVILGLLGYVTVQDIIRFVVGVPA